MSAPAATELPAACSKRASDIPRGEVDLPSLKQKQKRNVKGARNLGGEQFGELTPETIPTVQRGVESHTRTHD